MAATLREDSRRIVMNGYIVGFLNKAPCIVENNFISLSSKREDKILYSEC